MTTPAFEHLAKLMDRDAVHGKFATVTADTVNEYDSKSPSEIPANTVLQINFAGDFGLYAVADIDGILRKVKIPLHELHKVQLASAAA